MATMAIVRGMLRRSLCASSTTSGSNSKFEAVVSEAVKPRSSGEAEGDGIATTEGPQRRVRAPLKFIPIRMRHNIEKLYLENSNVWNAQALSERLGAPIENVRAIVFLRELEKTVRSTVGIPKAAQEAEDIWKQLPEPSPRAEFQEVNTKRNKMPARKYFLLPGEEVEEVGDDVVLEPEFPPTPTAEWVETLPVEEPAYREKRSSWIFMEIGKNISDLNRAIYVREGDGRRRQATRAERLTMLKSRRTGCAPIALANTPSGAVSSLKKETELTDQTDQTDKTDQTAQESL